MSIISLLVYLSWDVARCDRTNLEQTLEMQDDQCSCWKSFGRQGHQHTLVMRESKTAAVSLPSMISFSLTIWVSGFPTIRMTRNMRHRLVAGATTGRHEA
ncbi:hypothetical protein C8Q74DRAFT_256545 [Fomes fomentarius]|nr:hypothetical protein C8Q74DRAFT_256545 [Fomes fomentarius]